MAFTVHISICLQKHADFVTPPSGPALFLTNRRENPMMTQAKKGMEAAAEVFEHKQVGEGHFIQLEVPDEVNQVLEEFIEKHS